MSMTYRNGRAEAPKAGPSENLMNRFAAFIGQKFRAFEAEALASIDGKMNVMRRDFIQSVKSRAVELARYEVDGRIKSLVEQALQDHRAERVALARRVEELADQIERMKQGYQS